MAFISNSNLFNWLKSGALLSSYSYNNGNVPGWHTADKISNISNMGFVHTNFQYNLTARILESDDRSSVSISITGTDQFSDWINYPFLSINNDGLSLLFRKIVTEVYEKYNDKNIIITGHSLGGAVVNQIAHYSKNFDIKPGTIFPAFSSPIITDKNNILNVGFNDDQVFEIKNPGDSLSRPANLRFFGNSPVQVFLDDDSHSINAQWDAVNRLDKTYFRSSISYDSKIDIVGDMTKNSFSGSKKGYNNFDANSFVLSNMHFILGIDSVYYDFDRGIKYGNDYKTNKDNIFGSSFGDFIDGMGGDDYIIGAGGIDILYGGAGADTFRFSRGDVVSGEIIHGGGVTGEGNRLSGKSLVEFSLATINAISEIAFEGYGNFQFDAKQISETGINPRSNIFASTGKDELAFAVGTSTAGGTINLSKLRFQGWSTATDKTYITGNSGADTITGTTQNDSITGAAGADILKGGKGDDTFIFASGDATKGETIYGGSLLNGERNTLQVSGGNNFLDAKIAAISSLVFAGPSSNASIRSSQMGSVEDRSFEVIGSSGKDSISIYLDKYLHTTNPFTFKNLESKDSISIIGTSGIDTISTDYNAKIFPLAGNDIINLNDTASAIYFYSNYGQDIVRDAGLAKYDFGGSFKDYLHLLKKSSAYSINDGTTYSSGIKANLGTSNLMVESFGYAEARDIFTPYNTGLKYEIPNVKDVTFSVLEGKNITLSLGLSNYNQSANYKFSRSDIFTFDKKTASITFDAVKNIPYDIRAGDIEKFSIDYTLEDGYGSSEEKTINGEIIGQRNIHDKAVNLDKYFNVATIKTTVKESELREGHWIPLAGFSHADNIGINTLIGYQGIAYDIYDSPGFEPIKFVALRDGFEMAPDGIEGMESYDFTEESYYKILAYTTYNTENQNNAGWIGADIYIRIIDDMP